MTDTLESLLERYIGHWLEHRERLPLATLCPHDSDGKAALAKLTAEYHQLESLLAEPGEVLLEKEDSPTPPENYTLVEEIGRGRFGRVFKARDHRLERTVALKFIQSPSAQAFDAILKEARFLAALQDPSFTTVYALEPSHAVIIMEYVEGFDLMKVAPTLGIRQRAEILARLAHALAKAHGQGVLHLDLKPANIRLDTTLQPKILDFGLAQHLSETHHGWGTPAYAAPELFRPDAKVDARADLYALGAVMYEMLCGQPPFQAETPEEMAYMAQNQTPVLPKSLDGDIPAGLQAIALKCLERNPDDRYRSARELAQDLERFLAGADVLARPSQFTVDLDQKVQGHLGEIEAWRRVGLIFPHEEERLARGYRHLLKPLEDWLPASRLLTYDQIVLYLGVLVLFFGSVCLFVAHHVLEITQAWWYPVLLLGGAWFALDRAAGRLHAKTPAVAYDIAAAGLLPLLVLTLLHDWDWFSLQPGRDLRLFESGIFSNAQVQLAALAVLARLLPRAHRSRTLALGVMSVVAGVCLYLALLLNAGLKIWFNEGAYHQLALHLLPLLVIFSLIGWREERFGREFWAKPCFTAATVLGVAIPELLALNGKLLSFFGFSSTLPENAPNGYDPILFDSLVAMSFIGILVFYGARRLAKFPSPLLRQQSSWLYQISPFLMLEPLAGLVYQGYYGEIYHWLYLITALVVLGLSGLLQRKGFYWAGIANTVVALALITDHYHWLERRFWPLLLMAAGLILLGLGYQLYQKKRT